eukprot:6196258-Pleurochrysis_carterae.AAC.3
MPRSLGSDEQPSRRARRRAVVKRRTRRAGGIHRGASSAPQRCTSERGSSHHDRCRCQHGRAHGGGRAEYAKREKSIILEDTPRCGGAVWSLPRGGEQVDARISLWSL